MILLVRGKYKCAAGLTILFSKLYKVFYTANIALAHHVG
jgi:hypothetical protein